MLLTLKYMFHQINCTADISFFYWYPSPTNTRDTLQARHHGPNGHNAQPEAKPRAPNPGTWSVVRDPWLWPPILRCFWVAMRSGTAPIVPALRVCVLVLVKCVPTQIYSHTQVPGWLTHVNNLLIERRGFSQRRALFASGIPRQHLEQQQRQRTKNYRKQIKGKQQTRISAICKSPKNQPKIGQVSPAVGNQKIKHSGHHRCRDDGANYCGGAAAEATASQRGKFARSCSSSAKMCY